MDFEAFLKEAAPLLDLQWRRFKRGGIRRKIERRMAHLGFSPYQDYLTRIKTDSEERNRLSQILTVTVTRFFRDRKVFDLLESSILPSMIDDKIAGDLKIWSIGCAGGEEPYSLFMLWKERFEKEFPRTRFSVLATDVDESLFARARKGRYKKSSLREVPEEILRRFFESDDGFYILDRSVREGVAFEKHDITREEPFPGIDMILCRNSVFTYYSKECQIRVLRKITSGLKEKGSLIIGRDEFLPLTYPTLFVPVFPAEKIYQKFSPLASPLSSPVKVEG
mgnify:CR=1 FL=1